jgi:hypothetical protein
LRFGCDLLPDLVFFRLPSLLLGLPFLSCNKLCLFLFHLNTLLLLELRKLLHYLLLFKLLLGGLLSLVFSLVLPALLLRMLCKVFVLDEAVTGAAFGGLNRASVHMVAVPLDLEHLLTIGTRLGPHFAALFVRTERHFAGCKLAVLTDDGHVRLGLVLGLVGLGHHLAAVLALVVDPRALHLVHPKLGRFNLPLAVLALFGFLRFDHN